MTVLCDISRVLPFIAPNNALTHILWFSLKEGAYLSFTAKLSVQFHSDFIVHWHAHDAGGVDTGNRLHMGYVFYSGIHTG